MEEEGIGFKARFVSMLLRLITLGLIVVALSISTEGIEQQKTDHRQVGCGNFGDVRCDQ